MSVEINWPGIFLQLGICGATYLIWGGIAAAWVAVAFCIWTFIAVVFLS